MLALGIEKRDGVRFEPCAKSDHLIQPLFLLLKFVKLDHEGADLLDSCATVQINTLFRQIRRHWLPVPEADQISVEVRLADVFSDFCQRGDLTLSELVLDEV